MSETLTLGTGDLQIEVWPLGARLNRVLYKGQDCVAGSASREEALGPNKYNGAIVGPVANRIAGGQFQIDGHTYDLARNEDGVTTLHSGPQGVHALDWQLREADESAATLSLGLADGLGGFPGNRMLTAHYEVGGHDFTLTLSATSDAPTLMNLALHPYWTLDAGGRDGLQLALAADEYTPIDRRKIPTGEIADVSGSLFDLRQMATPSTAIDHNFCLTETEDTVLTLQGRRIRMEMETDAPGCQIFTGREVGIAIEPQHWPDAPHHDTFPSIELRPGETYRQTATYRFSRL